MSAMTLLRQLASPPANGNIEFFTFRVQLMQPDFQRFITEPVALAALEFLDDSVGEDVQVVLAALQTPDAKTLAAYGVFHTENGLVPGALYAQMTGPACMRVALRILQLRSDAEIRRLAAVGCPHS